jgi:RNA polymerase sigma-70 factor (ECF subfamily)
MESEEALIKRVQEGDTNAFGSLYDSYIEQIYRFVFYKTMHKEIAEDIVSDVFIKAFAGISSYTPKTGASFSAWLYTIARNKVIDYYRSKKTAVNIEDLFDIPHDAEIVENADAKELLSKIGTHLKTLNAKQREIVFLRVWEDMSYKEISKIVGGTEESVRMSFSRAMSDIRTRFGLLAAVVIFLLAARYN